MDGNASRTTASQARTGHKALLVALVGLSLLLAGCISGTEDGTQATTAEPAPIALESIPMVPHVDIGIAEQDVFVDKGDGAGVYRVSVEDAADPGLLDAPVYASAQPQEHNPAELGPFEKGEPLGFTLSDWLSGTGVIAYACQHGEATFDATFSNLVPDGVYTLWYGRLTMEEGAIAGVEEMPLGAPDGSQNTFTADEDGAAAFHLAGFPCVAPTELDESGTGMSTVFAIAYHSDGKTYGDDPGPFGTVSHVQLVAMAQAAQEA